MEIFGHCAQNFFGENEKIEQYCTSQILTRKMIHAKQYSNI